MNLYADSSFIVASRVRHDTFHRVALLFYKGHEADFWFWSPWHRVEVLNTIRQLTRNSDRKRSISQAEAKALIHRIEADVRLGYFFHMEADWRGWYFGRPAKSAWRTPSPAHARQRICSTLLTPRNLRRIYFVSFDNEQLLLAQAAGSKAVNPLNRSALSD